MALTEKEKQHIEAEEAYREKVREEAQYRHKISSQPKKGMSGCLVAIVIILVLPIFLAITLIAINPAKQFEEAEKKAEQARQWESNITSIPAYEIANMTEDEIKTTYAELYTNYSDIGLTPSGKVKITGFDIENAKIQIDYAVATNEPVYIDYSFTAEPLSEEVAWKVTGVSKPFAEATSNPEIMNRTVHLWENIEEIVPYKTIIAIYESDGKLSAISFSMEDIATSKSSRSLYYVP